MSEGQFVWRGLVLGDRPYLIESVTGWLGLPGGSYESSETDGHGIQPPGVVQGPRIVTIEGSFTATSDTRDEVVNQFLDAFEAPDASDNSREPLSGTLAGRRRTADAKPLDCAVKVQGQEWFYGPADWHVSWLCPDPRVFDDWLVSEQVPLVTAPAGVTLPQVMPFTMAARPLGGQVSVFNPGSSRAGSPMWIKLAGAQSGTVGVQLDTGERLIYALTLSADRGDGQPDELVIDTERGGAFLNGEYRPPHPTSSLTAEFRLKPRRTTIVRALGTPVGGSPYIQAAVRPAYL